MVETIPQETTNPKRISLVNKTLVVIFIIFLLITSGEFIYLLILGSNHTNENIVTLPSQISPSIAQITQNPSIEDAVVKPNFMEKYLSLCPQNPLCKKSTLNINLEGKIQSIEKDPKIPSGVEFKLYQDNSKLSENYRIVDINSSKAVINGKEGEKLNIDQLKIGDTININIEYDYLKKELKYIINLVN